AFSPLRATGEKSTPTDTLTVAVLTEADTTDLTISKYGAATRVVFGEIYDYLADSDWETGKSIPGIASWEVKEGGKVYEFKIQKGIKFISGDELTARDVEFSHNRLYESFAHYRDWLSDFDKVEVIDDYNIRFTFTSPNILFRIAAITGLPIVSKSYHDRAGEKEFVSKPVGTGPYKFVDWQTGQYTDLEANENYWGDEKAQVKKVRIVFAPEATTRVAMLRAGEVDMIIDTPWEQVPSLEKEGFKIWKRAGPPGLAFRIHCLNTDVPWYDKRVRQALAYGIDRKAIVNKLFSGIPNVYAWLGPTEVGYDPDLKPYPYDPNKAKALLAEAGYPDGFEMPIYYPTSGPLPGVRDVVEYITLALKDINIKCDVTGLEIVKMSGNLRKWHDDPTAVVVPVHLCSPADNRDPIQSMQMTFGTTSPTSMYSNPEADALIQQAQRTVDDNQRGEIIKKFYRLLNEELPVIPILANVSVYAMKPNVEYTPTTPFDDLRLPKVKIK
ncbi:MAG: ABC transporter substrate-binding protein, partial [Candidatus Hodarchaeota archaeon]